MIKHLSLLLALAIMISSLLAIPPAMTAEICDQ